MVTMGVFPFQGKTHMVEPGIEPRTSWLVVNRSSDHQATRVVWVDNIKISFWVIYMVYLQTNEMILIMFIKT